MARKLNDAAVNDFMQAAGQFVRRVRGASASHDLSWTLTSVMARLDRDVISQPGVKWMTIIEGINDIGAGIGPRRKGTSGT